MFAEENIEVPKNIAGLMCAAILSDTLMFRSPTCTEADKAAAKELAKIANIDIEVFAREMFKAGSNLKDKTPEEIFFQDYKKFIAGHVSFGVGQISSMDKDELIQIKEKLKPQLENECGKHGTEMIFFMLTDIMDESTTLISYGEDSSDVIREAFGVEPDNGECLLRGVVSRKKQLIPAMMGYLQGEQ